MHESVQIKNYSKAPVERRFAIMFKKLPTATAAAATAEKNC